MARQRARLKDNDPLSPTDEVLAGLEQISKSTSQPVEKSTSQQANKPTGQSDRLLENKQSSKQSRQAIEVTDTQQVNKPESQEVNKLTIRKATFQLSEPVLRQLDTFHLQLQLELGKANAPYKEVIVEEAIVQLLEQANLDRAKLIAALQQRQQQRE
jgi:hypothetical protein